MAAENPKPPMATPLAGLEKTAGDVNPGVRVPAFPGNEVVEKRVLEACIAAFSRSK
jgi:hypothetical protein